MSLNSGLPTDDSVPNYTADEMGIPSIRGELDDLLGPLEKAPYRDWRMEFARWAFHKGKNEYFCEGYSRSSMYNIMNSIEKFVVWLYSNEGFTTSFAKEHLDWYWEEKLMPSSTQLNTKRRDMNNVSLVLKMRGVEYSIPNSNEVYQQINKASATGFEDYFSPRELEAVKNASLRAFAVPDREEMDVGEQEAWATKLSQRIGKPKGALTDEDWAGVNSYKIPSLVYVSRDVGFRPTEIEKSRLSWLKIDDDGDGRLQIPKDEDSKGGKNNWRCYLSPDTVRILKLWLAERDSIKKYEGRDEIWLNRKGNSYNATSLRRIMQKLMDEAGISREDREQGWYMVRRGVGTEIANSQGLSALMSQMRISQIETAKRYVQTDEPSIREWMATR
ncbi:tyrosine-type recombinase/integrase [Haladaptatus sp. YSMS36]|uniref:tyrosine-type recombinase/integrase n=1 Tax=Haladaptatus sp. YSMS36 TaxID=3033384 RepID=UPI0023E78EA3|nr:tyrosine-type recombinase/integrase [Haladaptatus sp. YSMS36]